MSRVDEALKRVGGAVQSESVLGVRDRFTAAPRPPARIEDYAEEDHSLPERRVPEVQWSEKAAPAQPSSLAPPNARSASTPMTEGLGGRLVSDPSVDPASVEQYRRLATTLHQVHAERGTKVLVVSSALPREGKTLTSANLALTLSESFQRRVLLIDADLRCPSIHDVFQTENSAGLSDGLRSAAAPLPVIAVSDRLMVLPAGGCDSDPTAALSSDRMRALLAESAERFDWVILDSPPVGVVADATLLATMADGVILVIGAGSTAYHAVSHAIDQLGRERIIGTVLNRVIREDVAGGYYESYVGRTARAQS